MKGVFRVSPFGEIPGDFEIARDRSSVILERGNPTSAQKRDPSFRIRQPSCSTRPSRAARASISAGRPAARSSGV